MARTRAGRPADSRRPGLCPFQSAQGSAGLSVRKSVFEQTSGSLELKFQNRSLEHKARAQGESTARRPRSRPAAGLGCAEDEAELKKARKQLCARCFLAPGRAVPHVARPPCEPRLWTAVETTAGETTARETSRCSPRRAP